jgi:hypothetical protein
MQGDSDAVASGSSAFSVFRDGRLRGHLHWYLSTTSPQTSPRQREDLMSDDKPHLDPTKALADIQMLVRAALQSADPDVMRRDLELILTITEEALQPRGPE